MSQLVCADFDEFQEALYGVQGRYVLRSRPQRDWRLRVVELGEVTLMFGREGAGTVYSGVGLPGFFNVFLPLSLQECTVLGGQAMGPQRLGWMVPDAMFHIDACQPGSWMTVALSCEQVLGWAQRHEDEFDLALLAGNLLCQVQRPLAPLVGLALRLLHVDQRAPQVLHAPATERAAANEVLDTLLHSLLPVVPVRRAAACERQQRTLQRALALVHGVTDTPLHLADLCRACNTCERTLRDLFTRHLGMSPHRYLMLHRLHVIRGAILNAGPGETITDICARHGVWDFGRFAGQYQRQFGELPSQSLRQRRVLPPPGRFADFT